MQRSPVNFWLLLAATLAVDAVALSQEFSQQSNTTWIILYDALVAGQLSVLSIWASLRRRKTFWTRVAPVAAVLVAASIVGMFSTPPFVDMLPYYGLHVALLLALLWILERTSFWRRRTGAIVSWQYSVFELLLTMTVVAVLAASLRDKQWFSGTGWINLAFIAGSVSLAMVSTALWSLSSHWLVRMSGSLGFAIILGVAFMAALEPFLPLYLTAHYLIQAIVLSVWLGVGQIVPRADLTAAELLSQKPAPVQIE